MYAADALQVFKAPVITFRSIEKVQLKRGGWQMDFLTSDSTVGIIVNEAEVAQVWQVYIVRMNSRT